MKKLNIQPRKSQILIQQDEVEEESYGLAIPSTVEQERKTIGKVLAVGSDVKDLKKGDNVIYGTFAGNEIKLKESTKEVEFVLLHDDEILAIIK